MLKPVSILALDDAALSLAHAVQQRVATATGLDELVQVRPVLHSGRVAQRPGAEERSGSGDDWPRAITEAIESIHERRQRPESPLRSREDVSNRELVLLVVSSVAPAATAVIEVAQQIRDLYDMRRLSAFFTIEILCLLPGLFASTAEDYGAAYSLLKEASGSSPRPFDEFWLLDATNANRVHFGRLADALDTYAAVVAGVLTFEPEMSGAPAAHHPRGMDPTFSSFGYAELSFPRELALQRVEARLAADLVRTKLLAVADPLRTAPQLAAKQLVVSDAFAGPLSRIALEAGQSLFKRFQVRTAVTETTRSAEEVIAAVRAELRVHREGAHTNELHALELQREQTASELAALLTRVVDETLDGDDHASATGLLEALLDPAPDIHAGTGVAPRNLVTEIRTATAALDARLRFQPQTAASDAARARLRDLDHLREDQTLVADVVASTTAGEQLAAMKQEQDALTARLPEIIFAEEAENNAARNAAADAETVRLAQETEGHEQRLRDLFAAKPRAELALREALEGRRAYIWRQILWGGGGIVAGYAVPFALGLSLPHALILSGASLFAIYALVRYLGNVVPLVRAARESLERLVAQIETTDKAKNVAHNDELQFEYDVAHRRATMAVLRRVRESAKKTLDALRLRVIAWQDLADSLVPPSIASGGLSISLVEDADVDAWYDRTAADRTPFLRELPLSRSQSSRLPMDQVRRRIVEHAATAFGDFRKMTLADALSLVSDAARAQRFKRFADDAAPLIEVRDDDIQAQQAMQRDATLWIDSSAAALVSLVRRRHADAAFKPPLDPLRIHALSRVLHYPAYVLAQIAYYRAHYDPASSPQSANFADLLPTELVLSGPLRVAYEQVLLGRAMGAIHLREDGRLGGATLDVVLGDSHLAAAKHLASSDAATLRQDLDRDLAPRLEVAEEVERGLRTLLGNTPSLSPFDRSLIAALLARYGSEL